MLSRETGSNTLLTLGQAKNSTFSKECSGIYKEMENLKKYLGGSKIERPYNFVLDLETHNTQRIDGNEGKEFARTEFYHEYYRNLTPGDFPIKKEGNQIIIQIPSK